LYETIDRRGFCILWRRSDGAMESIRALAGLEAYATGWMGEKCAHE
jgi:hypothetical protein